jgi:hypothetical protein
MNIAALVLVATLAQMGAGAGANASASDPAAKDKAKALLKQGSALFEQGDYSSALERFEGAYAAYPSPKLKFNIGQANRALGRPVEALLSFEEFLSGSTDAAADAKEDAQRAVAELKAGLGRVRIDCSSPSAEIFLDGRRVGTSPLTAPLWATPGRHQVTVRHASFPPAVEDVEVAAGTLKVLLVQLRRAAPPPRIVTAEPQPAAPQVVTLPVGEVRKTEAPGLALSQRSWIAIGVTGALFAGATIAGLMANSRHSELEDSCGRTDVGCTEDQIDSVKVRARTSNVLWALGGVAAVASGVSIYMDSRERSVSLALRF